MSSGIGNLNFSLSGGGGDISQKKEEVKAQVRKELAMANAQELINNLNKHCFKMCLASPGSSLSSSDEGCISRCVDKFLASWDTVSRTYVARVRKEN